MTKPQLYATLAGAIGRLPTGEPYYAPIGRMSYDEDRVQCHLCGRWYKIVGAIHIRTAHGITLEEYREMFHLRGNVTTAAPQTSARKRATMHEQIDSGRRVQPADMPEHVRVPPGPPTVPRFRSLATLRPDLAAQLHPTRNPGLDPTTVGIHSSRRVWWCCPDCGTDWQREVKLRAGTRAYGCPACGKRRKLAATIARNKTPVPFERSLAHKVPDLLPELHPTRNPGLDPAAVGAGSERRVWWQCATCGHEWQTAIGDRASTRSGRPHRSGCPRCAINRRRKHPVNLPAARRPARRAERDTSAPGQPPSAEPAHSSAGPAASFIDQLANKLDIRLRQLADEIRSLHQTLASSNRPPSTGSPLGNPNSASTIPTRGPNGAPPYVKPTARNSSPPDSNTSPSGSSGSGKPRAAGRWRTGPRSDSPLPANPSHGGQI